jgi:GNAT superfamily N-acetyltransferase
MIQLSILKNEEIKASIIKKIRDVIMRDTNDSKFFLGVNSSNLIESLPIKNRKFDIWVVVDCLGEPIGFITFMPLASDESVTFIKAFYILPKYRNLGFGKHIMIKLYSEFPKLYCRINRKSDNDSDANSPMYKLIKVANMRGEKPLLAKKPMNYSNYLENKHYIND